MFFMYKWGQMWKNYRGWYLQYMNETERKWYWQHMNESKWYLQYATKSKHIFKISSEMTKKWPRNEQEMNKKWTRNDQEMTKKWPWNDQEMTMKYYSQLLWPISPVLICHSRMAIEWDFLKQSCSANLSYCPSPSCPVQLVCSRMAILPIMLGCNKNYL